MGKNLHIAIYGNPSADTATLKSVTSIINLLAPHCNQLDVVEDFYRCISSTDDLPEIVKPVRNPHFGTDIIISIGGDGTFLRAVSWEGNNNIPVAGLNGGHLGYLTGWTLAEIHDFSKAIIDGRYQIEHRSLIKVEFESLPDDYIPFALNEVAILKESTSNMISVRAEIDGDYLADYDGDGLIVATPTGSTGYNLSVGGPILEPHLPAWVVSPIAAHSLTMRPLVVSEESKLRLVATSRADHVLLSLDGRSLSIPHNIPVVITKNPFTAAVVRKEGATFIGTLREKLLWGIGRCRR